jgi:NTE family protein
MKRALVLAGGGVAGIAWELGVLRGIGDIAPETLSTLLDAEVIIGTSAGSTVAAQVTSGIPLADLYDAQLDPASSEIEIDVRLDRLLADLTAAAAAATSPGDARQRVGAVALATTTVAEAVRREAVAARLPVAVWPNRILLIPAVDANTGERVVFDPSAGVDLVDAVTASCAVPGVWPPVSIGGRRYIDGGVYSSTNADLAHGCDQVVIVTPSAENAPLPWGDLRAEISALMPARVQVVHADAASLAAFGTNPLLPVTRAPSAAAGRAVGRAAAASVTTALDNA